MAKYTLEYTDGSCTDLVASNDAEAERVALDHVGGSAYACDWDADEINDDGVPGRRLLIWACEEDSIDDDGGNAVAAVTCRE